VSDRAASDKTVLDSVSDQVPVKRALVSVYDKTGLEPLVRGLHDAGVQLVSTGGSAALIESIGLPVTRVEELTGFPECLDGRVKTLHPRVHAGILADRRLPDHVAQLDELGVEPFDLVVCNLYPFTQTVASGAAPDDCVEQIDIGGPSMVRAAAKNHPSVAIVTSPASYDAVLEAVNQGGFTLAQRQRLAAEAFVHTATYDVHVASWMGNVLTDTSGGTGFPAWSGATWDKLAVLRYGENPHQRAALYGNGFLPGGPGLAQATQHHGKEMSYNNYVDADAARRAAYDFIEPAVAIIKHANPCGIAVGADVAEAHRRAHACDPVSAFGGVIATNVPVSVEMARQVAEIFTEVIVAPGYEEGAIEALQTKKNIRILECPPLTAGGIETRAVSGGLLMQSRDAIAAEVEGGGDDPSRWTLATGEAASDEVLADLAFAWRAVRAAKSNAILLARDGASVGIGMGQVNRVDSCRLAVERANTLVEGEERARGAVAASDAFFPFADGPQILIEAGVRAIVQPGGSVRDAEVVEACEKAGITMYFTGTRHFFH
jgi:phosphoribosylaminoimidazolecarboxamide formyltransferase/IMP cyclohydrolase